MCLKKYKRFRAWRPVYVSRKKKEIGLGVIAIRWENGERAMSPSSFCYTPKEK
jgi:hypothetical protein